MVEFRRVAEVATWVGLFLLIPSTALGYFAEGSLPGQPLYSLKRGIEHITLTAQSFNSDAKALYEVELANQRLSESTKLLASNEPVYNFDDVYAQIAAARISISTISDPAEKKLAEQNLVDTISLYQEQLSNIQSADANPVTKNPTPTPITNSHSNTSSPTATPIQKSNNNNSDSSNDSSNQVSDFNNQLQDIKNDLTSPTPSPEPTVTPTPFQNQNDSASHITPTPTPTPAPHLPFFTYPGNGQSFRKGQRIVIVAGVLNGSKGDTLTVYVDDNKLCSGTYTATCYWTVPNHYNTNAGSFTVTAKVIDVYGRNTEKSINLSLSSNSDGSNHHGD